MPTLSLWRETKHIAHPFSTLNTFSENQLYALSSWTFLVPIALTITLISFWASLKQCLCADRSLCSKEGLKVSGREEVQIIDLASKYNLRAWGEIPTISSGKFPPHSLFTTAKKMLQKNNLFKGRRDMNNDRTNKNFSDGQRQYARIARELALNPPTTKYSVLPTEEQKLLIDVHTNVSSSLSV